MIERPILDSDLVWTEEMQQLRLASGRGVPIRLIEPSEAFTVTRIPELKGFVDRHGQMGTAVRWGTGVKTTEVKDASTGEVKARFTSKVPPETISSETEVTPAH